MEVLLSQNKATQIPDIPSKTPIKATADLFLYFTQNRSN